MTVASAGSRDISDYSKSCLAPRSHVGSGIIRYSADSLENVAQLSLSQWLYLLAY